MPGTPNALTRRQALAAAGAAAAGVARLHAAPRAEPQPTPRGRKPNLLFVFSDQHSWDMLGCYGHPQVRTPHLDQLAAEGVRFNHCVSNSPVCTPYRGMLMSGQHPLTCGCVSNDWQLLPGNGRHFGEVLRDAGYRTGYVGKWHLHGGNRRRPIPTGPHRHGFDGLFLSNNCHVDFRPGRCFYWDEAGKQVHFDEWEQYGQTRQALGFLDGCRKDEPFALFVSWHPPHNHCGYNYPAPDDLLKLYDPATVALRPNCPDTPRNRTWYAGYMALVSSIDRCVGWLMAKLKDKGLADDTLVVFTADHGDLLNSYGSTQCKCRPEHEACRVPLLVRYPGRLKPRASDLIVGTLDLMPTLLSLLGLPVPDGCHGADLSGAIREGRDDAAESAPLFIMHGVGWRGLYTRDHTYAFERPDARDKPAGRGVGFNCLYDNRAARYQDANLFGSPDHHDLQKALHARTLAWMVRFGDTFVPWRTLQQRCLARPEIPWRSPQQTGALKGRPIDLL